MPKSTPSKKHAKTQKSHGLDSTDRPTMPFGERFPTRDSAAVKALAANVKKLRKAREWSQYDLAAEAGIEQNAVSLIENERANPTLLVVEEIARALGVRLPELLENIARARGSRA
ncbi:MAG: transcriptional regulator, family [Bradyrhizobium sp.]|nr:transcriptional regulator, family [Bradyrhizobium sp.]